MHPITPIYNHNDAAYIVIVQKPFHVFSKSMDDHPNMEQVQTFMTWVGADHVLRTQTHFLFCQTIPDIELETAN